MANGRAPIAGGTETILVAEDEESVMALLVDLLQSQGYRVLTARDGAEAIARVASTATPIDLIVLDVVMPRLSGLEVVAHLRREAPHIPILLSTGFGTAAIDSAMLGLPGLAILEKPYSPYELFRHVRALLDARGKPPAP